MPRRLKADPEPTSAWSVTLHTPDGCWLCPYCITTEVCYLPVYHDHDTYLYCDYPQDYGLGTPSRHLARTFSRNAGKLLLLLLLLLVIIFTYITFLVFRTQQGSQQTTTGKTLIMSSLNDTSHSMLM